MDSNQKTLRRKKWFSRKSKKLRFNQKKLIETVALYKKKFKGSPKNSTHEFEYFSGPNLYWTYRAKNELAATYKKSKWKESKNLNNFFFLNKPEIKTLSWTGKNWENEFSIRHNENEKTESTQDKVFWKTSRTSLLLSAVPHVGNPLLSQNRLWRSLEYTYRLHQKNYSTVRRISDIFNLELAVLSGSKALNNLNKNELFRNSKKHLRPRKTRLSSWGFLRQGSDYRRALAQTNKGTRCWRFLICENEYSNKNGETGFSGRKSFFDDVPCCKNCDYDGCFTKSEPRNCSCCTCDKCVDDLNKNILVNATKQESESTMAPNSEEDSQIAFRKRHSWEKNFADKESLRPPVYNPEDYAISLKKWGRKPNNGIQSSLYISQSTSSIDRVSSELNLQNKKNFSSNTKLPSSIKNGEEKQLKKEKESTLKIEKKDLKNKENFNKGSKNELLKDFPSPISTLSTHDGEMSLRQFSTVTELLAKLKVDLKLSFPSFVQEFVGDPVDGVTLLLELLRAVQLSQASQQQKCPPQVLRRALLDEHSCLVCLKHCLRCSDATRRLSSSPAGLFTLAVCIMNNVTQTRIIALELLTKACEPPANGHKAVSEALSTLRLRFGEPVRFRFLVGMLNSAGAVELLAAAMKFINIFVQTAPNIQQKVYIQAELEQAGFDSKTLRRTLPCNSESVKFELNKWEKSYFDVEALQSKTQEVNALQEKINILEKRIQILQEEKGILQSLEQCLKERCSELEEEVSVKTNTTAKSFSAKVIHHCKPQQTKKNIEKEESTPAEDEGISSSEQELSQDEDYVKGAISYNKPSNFDQNKNSATSRNILSCANENRRNQNKNSESQITNCCALKNLKNIRSKKMKETNVDDGNEIFIGDGESNEEETTIDEVIEELQNIVNDAETKAHEEKAKSLDFKTKKPFPQDKNEDPFKDKYRTYSKSIYDKELEESEIVPSMLLPKPPRKAKSLVHIYFPSPEFDSNDYVKNEFFDEDTGSECSDSLFTATRETKPLNKTCRRSLEVSGSSNSFSSANTRTFFINQEEEYEESEIHLKLNYEERNIDEEEIKRKHLKNDFKCKLENRSLDDSPFIAMHKRNEPSTENEIQKLNKDGEKTKVPVRRPIKNTSVNLQGKTTSFQGNKKDVENKDLNEVPFYRNQKLMPVPIKRSQTFHTTTSEGENMFRRCEIKPKPKMGVRGLDFQRISEQKTKNEQCKGLSIEHQNSNGKYEKSEGYTKNIKSTRNSNCGIGERDVLLRRGSFDEVSSLVRKTDVVNKPNVVNVAPNCCSESTTAGKSKSPSKLRSKSLEKMDEGLDSLVDIVISSEEPKKPKIKNELNVEVTKNIGPRTRRSLAESSLFNPQFSKISPPELPKPPKPAERTSLTRTNSSVSPLHLPIEIKLSPVQPKEQQQYIYNFRLKSAKSDNALNASTDKRYPPDGACSPKNSSKNKHENQSFLEEKSPPHSTPLKQSKIQKLFGAPQFEISEMNQNFGKKSLGFGNDANEKSKSTTQKSFQNESKPTQKAKTLMTSSNQQTTYSKSLSEKENQPQSKPNFLLGTYQSSSRNYSLKSTGNSIVAHSINNFNNSILAKGGNTNYKAYLGTKKNCQECSVTSKEKSSTNVQSRQSNSNCTVESKKLTDSPSGLY